MNTVESLVREFVSNLEATFKRQVLLQLNLEPPPPRRNGATRKNQIAVLAAPPKVKRRKLPTGSAWAKAHPCPAPGCKRRPAPVFKGLCKVHKDAHPKMVQRWKKMREAKKAAATRRG